MSLQRDQALETGDSALQRVHTLTQANNNADRMIFIRGRAVTPLGVKHAFTSQA
jgi:hypothetical protein